MAAASLSSWHIWQLDIAGGTGGLGLWQLLYRRHFGDESTEDLNCLRAQVCARVCVCACVCGCTCQHARVSAGAYICISLTFSYSIYLSIYLSQPVTPSLYCLTSLASLLLFMCVCVCVCVCLCAGVVVYGWLGVSGYLHASVSPLSTITNTCPTVRGVHTIVMRPTPCIRFMVG